MTGTLDSIATMLQEISRRLDRLEGRGGDNGGPSYPLRNDQGPPGTNGPRPMADPIPMRDPSAQSGPITRDSYAGVSSRQPRNSSWEREPTLGRGISTHNDRVLPNQQTERPTIASTNRDFWFIISTIFNLVRLEYFRLNWVELPLKVGRALGDFVDMVQPPLPDDDWTEGMNELKRDIEGSVMRRTKKHIEAQRERLIKALNCSNPEDKAVAGRLAQERLNERYGHKIQFRRMRDYLQEVLSYIGIARTNTVNNPIDRIGCLTNPVPPVTPECPAAVPTPQPPPVSHKKRIFIASPDADDYSNEDGFITPRRTKKAKAPSSNPNQVLPIEALGVRPSFSVLEIEGENDMDDDPVVMISRTPTKRSQDSNSPPPGTPKGTRRNEDIRTFMVTNAPPKVADKVATIEEPIPPQPSSSKGTTSVPKDLEIYGDTASSGPTDFAIKSPEINATYHTGENKKKWRARTRPSTTVLVIGDSNMRLGKTRDSKYEVHAFSGANLSHAYDILYHSELETPITDIVVAIGINNRDCDFNLGTLPYLDKIARRAAIMDQRVHFLGVSTPKEPTLSIRELNKKAKEMFGTQYITPLPFDQVSVLQSDTTGIHHDDGTVRRILDSIRVHLGQQQFLNEY